MTDYVTAWSKVHSDKLRVPHTFHTFHVFYGTGKLIVTFTLTLHLSLT
jgi:hypothetical protein